MTDDFLTRAYADNHYRVSGDLGALIAAALRNVRLSLARLHAIQFEAPWRDHAAR